MNKFYLFFIVCFFVGFANAQNLASVSPNSANAGQTLNVTITGTNTHFVQISGTAVNFSFAQTSATSVVNSVSVVSNTVISANITVPVSVMTGSYNVSTTNSVDGTLTLSNSFYVNGVTPPSLSSISPSVASVGQNLNVTITGSRTHFAQVLNNYVSFSFSQTSGTTVVNSLNVLNDSSLQANITVPSNVVTGDYNVYVQNSTDGFITLNNGVHISGIAQPNITLINPNAAQLGQTLNVTITGANTHFAQGAGTLVDFTFTQASGTTVAPFVSGFNIINDSSIVANVSIPSNAGIGNYNVRVYDTIDGYLFDNFYVFDNCYSYFTTSYNVANNQFTLGLDSVTYSSAISYLWDFGDGSTSTLQTPSHLFAQDSIYNVCLTVKTSAIDSCIYCHLIGKDSSGVVLKGLTSGFSLNVVLNGNTVTGIVKDNNLNSDLVINAYPNPVGNTFTLLLNPASDLKNAVLQVYATDGHLVLEKSISDHKMTINTCSLANGIYFAKVVSVNGARTLKFVKQ